MKPSKTLRKKSRKRKSSRRRYNGGASFSWTGSASTKEGYNKARSNREERAKIDRAAKMLHDIEFEANAQIYAKQLAIAEVMQSRHPLAAARAAFYEEYGAPRPAAGPASDPIPGTAFELEVRKHTPIYATRRLTEPINFATATKEQANAYRAYSFEIQQEYNEDRRRNLFPYRYYDQKKYAERIISMIVVPHGIPSKDILDLFTARLMAFLVRLTLDEFLPFNDAVYHHPDGNFVLQYILHIFNSRHSSLCRPFFDGVTLIGGM